MSQPSSSRKGRDAVGVVAGAGAIGGGGGGDGGAERGLVERTMGWRTGKAFLTSLAYNLSLSDNPSPMASPQLPPSSPPTAVTAEQSTEEEKPPPPLTTTHSPDPQEVIDGLKLVVDSVAQQRQYASRAIIFNTLTLGAYVLFLSLLYTRMVTNRGDLPLFFTTSAGVTMACLIAIRWAVGGYIDEAETYGAGWLVDQDAEGPSGSKGKLDEVIVTKFGDEVIGVAVWRALGATPAASTTGKKKSKGETKATTAVVVRGWAVRLKYRHKGVGRALLEEVVSAVREKCGKAVDIKFADDFAGHKRLLPQVFNQGFDRREREAKAMLADVVAKST